MKRCGIPRQDGIVRIGVLCEECANRALKILLQEERCFYQSFYNGERECEACGAASSEPLAQNGDIGNE